MTEIAAKVKLDTFEEELSWIPDARVKMWTEDCIVKFPDYIFKVGASDSNNHHPYWDLGDGGCIRHIRAVTRVANMIKGTELTSPNVDKDMTTSVLISACILHDSFKYGTSFNLKDYILHPYIPRAALSRVAGIEDQVKERIFRCVESHMGSLSDGAWDLLPHVTKRQFEVDPVARLIHISDYTAASPDFIDPRFEDINKGVDVATLGHYEPYTDDNIRGLLMGEVLTQFGYPKLEECIEDGTIDNMLARVVSNKSTYSKRKASWSIDSILKIISYTVNTFLSEG